MLLWAYRSIISVFFAAHNAKRESHAGSIISQKRGPPSS
jgi:hypothetical protein